MTLAVSRFQTIDAIPEWAAVAAAGGFYNGVAWLRFNEEGFASRKDLQFTYLVLKSGETAVAAVSCYSAGAGVLPAWTDVWQKYSGIPEILPGEVYPLLHCGTPRGYAARLLIQPGLGENARKAALVRLLEEAKALARENESKTITFGHLPHEDAHELLACEPSMLPLYSHTDCTLDVPATFDAYLATLRHKQRNNAKLAMKHFDEEGFRLEKKPLAEVLDAAAPLIAAHEQKYGVDVDAAFVRGYFGGSLGRFDERTFCMMKGERLFGVFISFHQAGVYYARANGLDEAAIPKRAAAYSNLSYFEIREAMREGVTSIDYGAGSLDMKVRFGCQVTPRWTLAWSPQGFKDELRQVLTAEVRRRLQEDAKVLRAHHLPQLPEETIERLYGESLLT